MNKYNELDKMCELYSKSLYNAELNQYKRNWNMLKEYIDIKLYNTEYLQRLCGCKIDDETHIILDIIKEKMRKLEQALDENEKLINTILNFSFFEEECPLSFEFETISKEDKAQKIFYNDEYCEKNCNDNYKNCWLKYFKELQKAKGDVKNGN